tara:strand:- start:713 stop:1279 length:567 start_codon:yes stop_codon:yes gene_type:complete
MNDLQPVAQTAASYVFSNPTPAPRYFAHNIIDPIFKRLRTPGIDLNYHKKGNPETGEVIYCILASGKKQHSNGVNDPFAKAARGECMQLKIDKRGNIVLSQYITTRFGREPYGEKMADPKKGNTQEFRSLLNTFIYELGRYYTEPTAEGKKSPDAQNRRSTKLIRHLVFRDNPLGIRPKAKPMTYAAE